MKKTLLFGLLLSASLFSKLVTAHDDGLICSNYWYAQFTNCPADNIAFIKQQTYIPTLQEGCSDDKAICISDNVNIQPYYHPYAIYDIDNNEANRFQVKVTPTVINANGLVTQQGRIDVSGINSTQQESDFVKYLNEAQHYHKKVQDSLIYTQKNGVMYFGSEQSNEISSLNACKTAMNYINNNSNCGGILNNDIRHKVENSPLKTAIYIPVINDKTTIAIPVLRQKGPIKLGLASFDGAKLSEALNYLAIVSFEDDSQLALNIDMSAGVPAILENLSTSRASNGSTLKQFLESKNMIKDANSPDELESLINNQQRHKLQIHCRPGGVMSELNTKLVRTVVQVDKSRNQRVYNIYQRGVTYIAVSDC